MSSTNTSGPVQPTPIGYIDRKDIARLSNYKATIWPGTNEIEAVAVYIAPIAQPVKPVPLPKASSISVVNSDSGSVELRDNYTADQMRSYRQAAQPVPPTLTANDASTQERRDRITARCVEAAAKEDRIRIALYTLRTDCTTETTVIRVLHAISAGLMSTKPLASTDILETVGWIDALADKIQYRYQS